MQNPENISRRAWQMAIFTGMSCRKSSFSLAMTCKTAELANMAIVPMQALARDTEKE